MIDDETFWSLLARLAAEESERVVVSDDYGRTLSTSALVEAAETTAAGLSELGVEPGDVVSWQLPTSLEAVVLMAACARLGVVQNPIIPLLRRREVGLITRQLNTRILVAPASWRGFDYGAMAAEIGIATVLVDLEVTPVGPSLRLPTADASGLPPAPAGSSACRWVYYSSGTTADPKGVRHSDASVLASAQPLVQRMGFGPGDVYPIAWPFTHVGGVAILVTALLTGVQLVLFDTFDPLTTPERMAAHGPTYLGAGTPFFRAFLDAEHRHTSGRLFNRVKACCAGGASVPRSVNQELIDTFGVPGVIGAYGLTEFPNASCEQPGDPLLGTTSGPVGPGVEARIVDGELQLRGPQCFLGYADSSLDQAAFADGWFRTGDIASIDLEGRVRITGRLKDVIIRNAENISASEVEQVVLGHPDVLDVAVVGIPDERTGERVCAVVVLSPDTTMDVSALGAHCLSAGLARYKVPEQVHVVSSLDRNPLGKIVKATLAAQVRAALAVKP